MLTILIITHVVAFFIGAACVFLFFGVDEEEEKTRLNRVSGTKAPAARTPQDLRETTLKYH
jgi:hypothetical protein